MSLAAPRHRQPNLAPESFAFRFLLGFITATQVIGSTITLPAIPAIAESFRIAPATAQLTLTGFLLGVSAGQIVCGALADRFGRRPVILGGLLVFTVTGIGAAMAPSIEWLIGFRTAQGIGGAAGMIVGRAMVRDLFEGRLAVKMMSFITSVISLVPMMAPMLGSLLLEVLSWRATLAGIAILSAPTAVITYLYLGETLRRPDPDATKLRIIRRNVGHYFRTPQCTSFVMVMITSFGGLFAAMALLPFVAIRVFDLSSVAAAASVATLSIAVLVGSRLSARLSERVSQRRTLTISISLAFIAGLCILWASHLELQSPFGFVMLMIPATAHACVYGITQPNAIAATLQPVPEIAGLASAINGSLQMAVGGLFVWLGGVLFDGTASTIGICVALGASLTFVSYFAFARKLAS